MHTIREAHSDDLETFCTLWNAAWPNFKFDAEQLARDGRTLPEPMRAKRWLAEIDGCAVGYAEAQRPVATFHMAKWMIEVGVKPEFQGRGIGSGLYSAAEAVVKEGEVLHVSTHVREDDAASLRFATARGFREIHRDFESLLDLGGCDNATLETLRLQPQGVRLETLASQDSPEFRRVFHELFEEVRKDTPRPEPPVRMDFEFFEQHVLLDPDFLPEGSWVALDGDVPVGFCGIYRGVNDGWVDQWLTAVARSHRKRGVALALKAATILWAKGAGYSTIRTDNNSLNARMLEINDRLGFKRSAAILLMRTGGPSL